MKVREIVAMLAVALVVGVAYDSVSERSAAKCACGVPLLKVASAKSAPATRAAKKPGLKKPAKPAPKKPAKPVPKAGHKVIVTYFHRTARCTTCMTIEAWTAKALQDSFGADIKAGRVEWRVVNIDQPENEQFVKDYNLSGSTAIVSDVKSGKQARWKSLEKVWDLVGNEAVFQKYIRDEVGVYIKGA